MSAVGERITVEGDVLEFTMLFVPRVQEASRSMVN